MARRAPASSALRKDVDERTLIEAAQRDPGRFAELYESNFDRVYAFVVRRVRDREEAEDVTSEVFHRALANLGQFEWRGVPFAAWLLRIAANANQAAVFDVAEQAAGVRAIEGADGAPRLVVFEVLHVVKPEYRSKVVSAGLTGACFV